MAGRFSSRRLNMSQGNKIRSFPRSGVGTACLTLRVQNRRSGKACIPTLERGNDQFGNEDAAQRLN